MASDLPSLPQPPRPSCEPSWVPEEHIICTADAGGSRGGCQEQVDALHLRLQELRTDEVRLVRLRDEWLRSVDAWVRRLEGTLARCNQWVDHHSSSAMEGGGDLALPLHGVGGCERKLQAAGLGFSTKPPLPSPECLLGAEGLGAEPAMLGVFGAPARAPAAPLPGLPGAPASPLSVGGWCSDVIEDCTCRSNTLSSDVTETPVLPAARGSSDVPMGISASCAVAEPAAHQGQFSRTTSPGRGQQSPNGGAPQDFVPVLPSSAESASKATRRSAPAFTVNGLDPVALLRDKPRNAKQRGVPVTERPPSKEEARASSKQDSIQEEEETEALSQRQSLFGSMGNRMSFLPSSLRFKSAFVQDMEDDTDPMKRSGFRPHRGTVVAKTDSFVLPVEAYYSGIVELHSFHVAVGVLIVCSTACNGIEAELLAAGYPDADVAFFNWLQLLFAVCFAIELILRLNAHRWTFFTGFERSWNIFDMVLVALSMGEVYFTMRKPGEMSSNAFMQLSRVLRNLRLFRLMRHFQGLKHLIISLLGSLNTMANLSVLLAMYIYMFAFCFTSAATSASLDQETSEELKTHFGSLGASCLSLFMCMTNGVSWGVVAEPLQSSNFALFALLCFYILIAVFALMNAVTSVFVENISAAQRKARDHLVNMELQLQQETVDKLQELFIATDEDGSGSISRQEFNCYMQDERAVAYLRTLGIEGSEADNLFDLLDADGNGDVEIEEFVRGCLRIKGEAKSVEIKELHMDLKKVMKVLSILTERIVTTVDDRAASKGSARR